MLRLISSVTRLCLGSGGDLAAEIVDLHYGVGHGVEAAGDLPVVSAAAWQLRLVCSMATTASATPG